MKIAHVKVETPEKCPFYKSWADYITHKVIREECRFENRNTPCDWDNCPLEDKPSDASKYGCPICRSIYGESR